MAYIYPYGDTQQLNLDWIINKLKETGSGNADLEEVSKALIALKYNTGTIYAVYDYAFYNGKLYRCLAGTTGAFDPAAWQEALIGDDVAILTRWINALDAAAVVDVKFDTSGTNGKIQQKYNDAYHDVVVVDYTPVQDSKRPLSSNAGYVLNGVITHDTLHDTKTAIASDPASIDDIKDYDVGVYRVAISGTTIFPEGFGILEILKAQDYGVARFSNINASNPITWRVEWNTNSGSWYNNVWTDEQKYIKDLTALLPVTNGGTGANSASGARTNLGLGSVATENTVPINKGGTGATTAANARKTLGLCYAAGDTFAVTSSLILSGIASASLKSLYFDVPVDKSTENIYSVSVTAMSGYILGAAGRVDGSGTKNFADTSVYTTSCSKQANNHIRIGLEKVDSTAFTGLTTESPVAYFGTITLTFA